MKSLALLLLLAIPLAQAKDKGVYHDAILVNFGLAGSGVHCSTTGTVQSSNGGQTATTGSSTNCTDGQATVYQIALGGHVYALEPFESPAREATLLVPIAGLAYFIATTKNNVLYGVLPGTAVQVRSETAGIFYVRVGKKESRYKLVGAQ